MTGCQCFVFHSVLWQRWFYNRKNISCKKPIPLISNVFLPEQLVEENGRGTG